MKPTDNNRLPYEAPRCEVMELECEQMMMALSGYGSDSDDSEFGASERRGEWGNFWE